MCGLRRLGDATKIPVAETVAQFLHGAVSRAIGVNGVTVGAIEKQNLAGVGFADRQGARKLVALARRPLLCPLAGGQLLQDL